MPYKKNYNPKLRFNRTTGGAVATFNGRDIDFGEYGMGSKRSAPG